MAVPVVSETCSLVSPRLLPPNVQLMGLPPGALPLNWNLPQLVGPDLHCFLWHGFVLT